MRRPGGVLARGRPAERRYALGPLLVVFAFNYGSFALFGVCTLP